ncbi:hypothetical protein K7X08_026167 [Anisodus acutangulus]|uniref:non-specific serine/threonine protein kinase n=1 Tax=Anisodus acutangulus TaxID=402998 RepID=A0A9Q1N220_9SOLA|nr:hypothetical protein K7X08_026167 [Anisodus acutangulus]
MSIVSPPPSSSTSFAAPSTVLNSPAPISQPNDNSSSVASPPPVLPPQSAPPINVTSPPIALSPLPQSPPPPTNTTLSPPASSPPPDTSPIPPAESVPRISPPPTPSVPPANLTPPPTSSPPASSPAPPSSTTPSNPPPPLPEPTRPISSPPPPSIHPPALSPPHSSTLPPTLSPLPPVRNPRTHPAPRSPGNPSPEPPKHSSPSPPLSKPPKNSPPSPAALPPSNSASSSSPPTDPSIPTPTAQLSPPQSSNSAQPSLTPPSPSFPSGDNGTTTSSNSSADRSKAADDGRQDGANGSERKKDSGPNGGGYILPATLVSSQKPGSASLKVRESTPKIGNGAGSNIVNRNNGGLGYSKPWFTYQELVEATNEFSEHYLLGEGGFGSVYKGCLADGRDVAVKKLNIGGGQGEREFRAEVEIISRIHHRHLVSLVGYCIYENGRLLVYEYVPNDTLYFHLHERGRPVMDWATRVKIAVGAARGIAYLHEDCCPRIIHRDIKSSNILLDDNFDARVADFGLAKLAQDAKSHVTTRVMGTFGYMAPEYASSGKLTEKSDVYSFGVVLLELITGRKPVDTAQPLLGDALEKEEFDQLADPRLEKNYVDSEMFRMIEVAAACVRHSAAKRPGMGEIMRAFDSMLMSDLTNGMKVGESAIYNSAEQSAQIRLFRRMAFASQDLNSYFSSQSTHYSRELAEHV